MLCSSILIDFVMIAEQNGFLWWSVHVLMTHYVHQVKHANETQPAECHAIQASVSHVAEGPPGKPYNTHKAKKQKVTWQQNRFLPRVYSRVRLVNGQDKQKDTEARIYRRNHIYLHTFVSGRFCYQEKVKERGTSFVEWVGKLTHGARPR